MWASLLKTTCHVLAGTCEGFGVCNGILLTNVTNGLTYIDIVKRYISDTTSAGVPLHSASEYLQVSVKVCAKGAKYFSCVLL